jgi:hypothetical protein
MRYSINFEKLINRLLPHFLCGRKLILVIRSLVEPLQSLNDEWCEWAREKRIETRMTSQVILFEWYLNRKFSKYFLDPQTSITIDNGESQGTAFYFQSQENDSDEGVNPILRLETEVTNSGITESAILFTQAENTTLGFSFVVNVPAINTAAIKQEVFLYSLKYYIDKYKITNKTYKIIITE